MSGLVHKGTDFLGRPKYYYFWKAKKERWKDSVPLIDKDYFNSEMKEIPQAAHFYGEEAATLFVESNENIKNRIPVSGISFRDYEE